jgi:outer membrane receptor protein involved in Fe transport
MTIKRILSAAVATTALGIGAGAATAQDSDLEAAIEPITAVDGGEITVTATRSRRDPFNLPQSVAIFSRDDIQTNGSFVALQAISRRDAAIWYDERTATTTDPIIRGFAGFNLLTLIDGNTLSTLWGEGGFGADDMYGKIDPETVERIEVIRGAGSALYGSNALGAVINVITRASPLDYTDEGYEFGGRVKLDVGSAADAGAIRTEVYGATPDLRFLFGVSARDWDDVRGGDGLHLLEPSDGRERNWDLSAEARLGDGRFLRLTVQDVHRDHIKRYYRPTQDNHNDREAVALFFRDDAGNETWDALEARLYWQDKVDERRFFDTDERGRATTTTYQAGLQATRDVGDGHVLTAGVSAELDEGDSPDDEQFTIYYPGPTRRDAPLTDWWDFAIFVQDEWQIDDVWSVVASARWDHMIFETDVDSKYVPAIGNPEDDEFRDTINSVTGGLGAVFRATPELHLTANYARGFRQNAPNFGTRQLGDGILIPNQLLDPTTVDSVEVGVKGRYEGLRFSTAYYHSFIDNWQGDLRPTTFNGSSFLDFNRNGTRDANEGYVTQVEGGEAYVRGVEAHVEVRPNAFLPQVPPHWSVWGSFAYNTGSVDSTKDNPMSEPLRHTQPMRGLLGIRWDDVDDQHGGLFVELVADMVGRFDAIPSDRQLDDLAWRREPQDGGSPLLRDYIGTPGYTIFSLHAGMNLAENVRVRVGVENFTNKKYRVAHSRMDAPGIDVSASLEFDF